MGELCLILGATLRAAWGYTDSLTLSDLIPERQRKRERLGGPTH